MHAISEKCNIYNYLQDSLKYDKEILLSALRENQLDGKVLAILPEILKNDINVIFSAIEKSTDGSVFNYVSPQFKYNREFLLQALALNGFGLQYVDHKFKDDKELVMVALNNSGEVLKYASEKLQDDKELVQLSKKMIELKTSKDLMDDLPF